MKLREEHGVALVEFAIILPLLVFVSIFSLELVRISSSKKLAVQISREAVNLAFRDCAGRMSCVPGITDESCAPPSGEQVVLMNACLKSSTDVLLKFVTDSGVNNAKIILTYYFIDTASPRTITLQAASQTSSTRASKLIEYTPAFDYASPRSIDLSTDTPSSVLTSSQLSSWDKHGTDLSTDSVRDTLFAAEVFIEHQSMFPGIVNYLAGGEAIYEATLL